MAPRDEHRIVGRIVGLLALVQLVAYGGCIGGMVWANHWLTTQVDLMDCREGRRTQCLVLCGTPHVILKDDACVCLDEVQRYEQFGDVCAPEEAL